MKFLAIFFSVFALSAAQYYYEAPAAAAPVVNTYNSYLPYASPAASSYGYYYPSAVASSGYATAPAAAYPAYYAAYGSNKATDEKPMPPTAAKLTNNA